MKMSLANTTVIPNDSFDLDSSENNGNLPMMNESKDDFHACLKDSVIIDVSTHMNNIFFVFKHHLSNILFIAKS